MVIHACNAEWLSLKMRTHINIRQGWQDTPTSIQFNALRAKIDWHRRYTEARQSKASNKCRCPPAADRTRKRRCHRRTATLRSYLHGGNRRRNEFLWALVARPLRRYHHPWGFIQRPVLFCVRRASCCLLGWFTIVSWPLLSYGYRRPHPRRSAWGGDPLWCDYYMPLAVATKH